MRKQVGVAIAAAIVATVTGTPSRADELGGDGTSESVEVRVMVAGYAEVTLESAMLLLRVPRPGATATASIAGTVRSNIPVSVQLTGSGDAGRPRITLNSVDGTPFGKLAGENMGTAPFAWSASLQVGANTSIFSESTPVCRIDDVPAGTNPLAVASSLTTNADFGLTAAAGTTNAAETLVVTVSG